MALSVADLEKNFFRGAPKFLKSPRLDITKLIMASPEGAKLLLGGLGACSPRKF